MSSKVIFDFAASPFPWVLVWSPLGAVVVASVGIVLARAGKLKPRGLYLTIGYIMIITASASAIAAPATWLAERRSLLAARNSSRVQTVEGTIQDYRPMSANGKNDESFSVGQQAFTYSDYNALNTSPCFNRTAQSNGPIRLGMSVRIEFSGNCILRIESLDKTD